MYHPAPMKPTTPSRLFDNGTGETIAPQETDRPERPLLQRGFFDPK
jgi:hypothetical protein